MPPPRIHLAFARTDARVSHVNDEHDALLEALAPAQAQGLCEVSTYASADAHKLIEPFLTEARDLTAVLHYGGHANQLGLFLRTARWQDTGLSPGDAGLIPDGADLAYWEGLVGYLSRQPALKLVFLNGCSTIQWGSELATAGVPVVIGTTRSVSDPVAARFAEHFYTLLGGGASIREAFDLACARIGFDRASGARRSIGQLAEDDTGSACPWTIATAPGADEALRLTLAGIAGLPHFGLPPLPRRYYQNLPRAPFVGLHPFGAQHAPLFFGRRDDLVRLIGEVTGSDQAGHYRAPLLLLYGQTGVGKSSLLAAGLRPRLEATHDVRYARRAPRRNSEEIVGTLQRLLAQESQMDEQGEPKPLVLILDQVEEAWTQGLIEAEESDTEFEQELSDLVAGLKTCLEDTEGTTSVILSFRKEWLAEMQHTLQDLRYHSVFIRPLDWQGVEQAIFGVTQDRMLRDAYRLTVEAEDERRTSLVRLIRDDLTVDMDSPLAPVLQILLLRMWEVAKDERPSAPRFSVGLYEGLRQQGDLLRRFVERQFDELSGVYPGEVESGLVLDLLEAHTTETGTSRTWSREALRARYRHASDTLEGLLSVCQRLHLLIDPAPYVERVGIVGEAPPTRLGHDTLAPLVRAMYVESDRPGQQARRVLEHRVPEWRPNGALMSPNDSALLDDYDLAQAEKGLQGMRALEEIESNLLSRSRDARAERQRRARLVRRQRVVLRALAGAFVALVLLSSVVFFRISETSRGQDLVEQSTQALAKVYPSPAEALAYALEAWEIAPTLAAEGAILSASLRAREQVAFMGHRGIVRHAAFSPQGTHVVTASDDGTARVWDIATGALVAVMEGHEGGVYHVAFSPDGTQILTASSDHTARLWDALSGTPLAVMEGHGQPVTHVAFSPDGTFIVTASRDYSARLWDATEGTQIAVFFGHSSPVTHAAFSPDGETLVTTSNDSTGRLWDAATGNTLAVLEGHTDQLTHAAFSPDGAFIVTASRDDTARLWDAKRGVFIRVIEGHTSSVTRVAFSTDGTRILTAGDRTARLWNTETGVQVAIGSYVSIRAPGSVSHTSFSPDDTRILALCGDGTARLWDSEDGTLIAVLEGHQRWLTYAAFSPDGTRILTTSSDHTARVWDINAGGQTLVLDGHNDSVHSSTFSPDGNRILTASRDRTAILWDANNGRQLSVFNNHQRLVNQASFSPDGTRILTTSQFDPVQLWSASTGERLGVLSGHASMINHATFSPNSDLVVTASFDNTAQLWSSKDGLQIGTIESHISSVEYATFSPDGSRIVTASQDNTARVWNVESLDQTAVLEGHSSSINFATFSPDGAQILTASLDRTARLWDATSGTPLAVMDGHLDQLYHAAFSSDGSRIVTASGDGTVRLWDAMSGIPVGIMEGHTGSVYSAAFSRDGTRVITAGDRTVRLWNANTGAPLAVIVGHDDTVLHAEFSPDGTRLVTASRDGTSHIHMFTGNALLFFARQRLPVHLDERCERAEFVRANWFRKWQACGLRG